MRVSKMKIPKKKMMRQSLNRMLKHGMKLYQNHLKL